MFNIHATGLSSEEKDCRWTMRVDSTLLIDNVRKRVIMNFSQELAQCVDWKYQLVVFFNMFWIVFVLAENHSIVLYDF